MIRVKDLQKKYRKNTVLTGISFHIEQYGIYGLLGPNGAGKSTLLKILAGSQFPGSGEIRIYGLDIYNESLQIRKLTGYLPENAPVDLKLRVHEYLFYIASLKGLKGKYRKREIEKVVTLCRLSEEYTSIMGLLSKGYRQRVGLAQALLGSPRLLLLDEPLSGMDVEQIIAMKELLVTLSASRIIILSTHILQEIESLCTRTYILLGGKLVRNISINSDISLEKIYLDEVRRRGEE